LQAVETDAREKTSRQVFQSQPGKDMTALVSDFASESAMGEPAKGDESRQKSAISDAGLAARGAWSILRAHLFCFLFLFICS